MISGMGLSNAERFALLPEHIRNEWLADQSLDTLEEIARGEWWWLARPEQVPPPGDWLVHLALAGRGWGKSKSGAEWIVESILTFPTDRHGTPTEWLVIAETLSDSRIICLEGPAGILRVLNRRGIKYRYTKAPKPMVVFENGSKIYCEGADDADVGRGYNAAGAWCIAEGEPILTRRGHIPIEDVLVGDEVMTRSGWHRVVRSGKTAENIDVVRIETPLGSVRLTANHRVWTQRGWVEAGKITVRDSVYSCLIPNLSQPKHPPTTSGATPFGTSASVGATTRTAPEASFIAPSGQLIMAPSLRATRSTMSIESHGTTDSTTFDSSPQPSIEHSPGKPVRQVDPPALPGGSTVTPGISSATSAGNTSSPPTDVKSAALGSAVVPHYGSKLETVVLRVVKEEAPAHVYDLSVEGEPEFFAGTGVLLVHNCDEICKWKNPKAAWMEGIMPSLRADLLGDHPRVFVTTTPKPIDILREWVARKDGSVSVVRGSTFDNSSNLSQHVVTELRIRYDGTAIGRQELYGELMDALDGALFSRLDMENSRVLELPADVISIGVGVDPNLTGEDDEMGVVVMARGRDNHLYIVADRSATKVGRDAALHCWRVVAEYGADVLLYESNLGKVWMAEVLTDAYKELQKEGLFPAGTTAPMKAVDSKHGKKTRAEPVAMRLEQQRLHFVGRHEELEKQCAEFVPDSGGDSPDRMDAMVHVARHFMAAEKRSVRLASPVDLDALRIPEDWRDRYSV